MQGKSKSLSEEKSRRFTSELIKMGRKEGTNNGSGNYYRPSFGGLYALIGVGLSLIFGIVKVTNIAHGDLMIVATFFIMVIVTKLVDNIYLALGITIVIMAIIGVLIQKFLINTVIDKGATAAMLVMFGLSIAIRTLTLILARKQHASFTGKGTNFIQTDTLSISGQYALNFIVGLVLIVALALIMDKTPSGVLSEQPRLILWPRSLWESTRRRCMSGRWVSRWRPLR